MGEGGELVSSVPWSIVLLVAQQCTSVPTTYVKTTMETIFMHRTHKVYVINVKVATRGGERRPEGRGGRTAGDRRAAARTGLTVITTVIVYYSTALVFIPRNRKGTNDDRRQSAQGRSGKAGTSEASSRQASNSRSSSRSRGSSRSSRAGQQAASSRHAGTSKSRQRSRRSSSTSNSTAGTSSRQGKADDVFLFFGSRENSSLHVCESSASVAKLY
jgi:hypothetical protein